MALPAHVAFAPTTELARRAVAVAVLATACFLAALLLGTTPAALPGQLIGSVLCAAGVAAALAALIAMIRRGERSVVAILLVFPFGPLATLFLMEFARLME